ncbi:MAG: radical SAM protein [Desulfobacteraceae bacterium]|nr:radical SAM protein [Desulfobacteraceae bacterium]
MSEQELIETPKRIYGERVGKSEKTLSHALGPKYAEYRKEWVRVSNREKVTEFPLYIQIEHSGKCNLRCKSCIHSIDSIREEYSKGFKPLDINLYKKILDEANEFSCPSMAFHNNDEPLLLKDLEERIKMASVKNIIDIIVTTNATLLDEKRADKLLRSGLTKINFSVDAYNRNDYSQIRCNGDFDTVLKNIIYFCDKRNKEGLDFPITRATCVLNKFTIDKMKKIKEFWEGIVDIVEFQNFQAIKNFTEWCRPSGAKIDQNFVCNGPWQQIVIRANGDVVPCCSFYGTEIIVGNIKNTSIYNIWNGKEMSNIRKELLKNNFEFSSACKKCSETFYIL